MDMSVTPRTGESRVLDDCWTDCGVVKNFVKTLSLPEDVAFCLQ